MQYQKTYNSPRLNGQFPFCSFPFALDTYSGCTHLCKYCFSYYNYLINCSTKNNEKDFFSMAKTINFSNLEKAFEQPDGKDNEHIRAYRELIKLRMPIHWGGVSDPFSTYEQMNDEKVSLKCLKLFNKHQYPVISSTKSKWLKDAPEYIKEIQENKNFVFQVSLISLNERMKKIEPGTSVEARLELIRIFSKTNRVVVRCQPFIPNLDNDEQIEEFVKTIADCGAHAVTMEFLKISAFQTAEVKKAIEEMSEALGYDIPKFFRLKGNKAGTDIELRFNYKLPIMLKFRQLAHKYGLEFYSAENSMRDYGDGYSCCGIPKDFPEFGNRLKSQTGNALFLARKNGRVYFDDIFGNLGEPDKAFLSKDIAPWLNLGSTEGHLRGDGKTFLEKAAQIWDNPSSPNNPASFYKNLRFLNADKGGNPTKESLDENGHFIYEYIPSEGSCDGCSGCSGCNRAE